MWNRSARRHSISEHKGYGHYRAYSNGPSVEKGGLVLPLLHSVERRRHQEWMSRHDFHLGDVAVLVDDAINYDLPADSGLLGQDRIDRLDFGDETRSLNFASDAIRSPVQWGRWGRRNDLVVSSARDCSEDTAKLPTGHSTKYTTEYARRSGLRLRFALDLGDLPRNYARRVELYFAQMKNGLF